MAAASAFAGRAVKDIGPGVGGPGPLRPVRNIGTTGPRGPLTTGARAPYTLPPVPAGTYNPTLDAELSASQRGVQDVENEVGTQQARDTTDYGLGVEGINREAQQGLQSIATSRERQAQDYQQ